MYLWLKRCKMHRLGPKIVSYNEMKEKGKLIKGPRDVVDI